MNNDFLSDIMYFTPSAHYQIGYQDNTR